MFRKCVVIAFIIILTLVSGASAQDYIVGEGDVLQITVYEHPDLTTTARIGGHGTITLPLIGQISVQGLTLPQISV